MTEDFVVPRKKPVRLYLMISAEANDILRSHCRYKGDMSRFVDEAIKEKKEWKTQS